MAPRRHLRRSPTSPATSQQASALSSNPALLPIGALLLAGSINALAQTAATGASKTLPTVTVTEKALAPEGKDTIRTTTSTIGKGNQQLRDIPQSVTVVTEKLIDDRNLDTLKDVLHNTAGITFLAAEGGEGIREVGVITCLQMADQSKRGFDGTGTGSFGLSE